MFFSFCVAPVGAPWTASSTGVGPWPFEAEMTRDRFSFAVWGAPQATALMSTKPPLEVSSLSTL